MLASLDALGAALYLQTRDLLHWQEELHYRADGENPPKLSYAKPITLAGRRGARR